MLAKAVALLSGGLDSTLAVKLMLDQGIDLVALNFVTPFCTCTAKSRSCKSEAVRVARELGIPVRVRYKGMEYLKVVESPRHGRGRGLNPCVDCRIFMHRAAKELMAEEGASFLVTGEVLGQRPMSQRRDTLRIIERDSGTEGLVLRPLSARHFEPTLAEREGWVDRGRLLAIEGRSRKEQIRLAEELGVTDYPCPAGGCLLTDPDFAARLKDLFDHKPGYDLADVRLLRTGRHFRLHPGLKVVVGRDQMENDVLDRAAGPEDWLIHGLDFRGPTALCRESPSPGEIERVGRLLLHYAREPAGVVEVVHENDKFEMPLVGPLDGEAVEGMRLAPFRRSCR
jgi:tRNA-specific 2-thiouridylase